MCQPCLRRDNSSGVDSGVSWPLDQSADFNLVDVREAMSSSPGCRAAADTDGTMMQSPRSQLHAVPEGPTLLSNSLVAYTCTMLHRLPQG